MTSILKVDSIQNAAGSVTIPVMSGGIIQVQYTQFTGATTFNTTSNTWQAIPDINVNITPTSTNSKIMVQMFIGGWESVVDDHAVGFCFYRDSTRLAAPTAGSRNNMVGMGATNYHGDDNLSTPAVTWITYFDEPLTTSQVTYKGGVITLNSSGVFALNRTMQDSDANGHERTVSSITVTEIAG